MDLHRNTTGTEQHTAAVRMGAAGQRQLSLLPTLGRLLLLPV